MVSALETTTTDQNKTSLPPSIKEERGEKRKQERLLARMTAPPKSKKKRLFNSFIDDQCGDEGMDDTDDEDEDDADEPDIDGLIDDSELQTDTNYENPYMNNQDNQGCVWSCLLAFMGQLFCFIGGRVRGVAPMLIHLTSMVTKILELVTGGVQKQQRPQKSRKLDSDTD